MQFQSAVEVEQAAKNAENPPEGEVPEPVTYTAEKVNKTTEVSTPWGNAIAMPGTFIFTSQSDKEMKFIVTDDDAHNQNIWVPA